jgi:hypothetical protein
MPGAITTFDFLKINHTFYFSRLVLTTDDCATYLQLPFLVETKMVSSAVKGRLLTLFMTTPEAYARAAVRWIGHGVMCVPSFVHRLECLYLFFSPDFLIDRHLLRRHLKQRTIFRRLRSWRKSHDNCVAIENNGLSGASVMADTKVMPY